MPLVQTRGAASAQGFGEFAQAAPAANYIEDVFSTYLYTGNTPSTNTIVNGIDLATKGGMVWTKTRSSANSNTVWDTARGVKNLLITNQTAANLNIPVVYPSFPDYGLQSFNTTGFTLGKDWEGENQNGETECSWTFRKQAKFFDVVTFTSDASNTNQRISHNLGSTPGCIFVKRTSSGDGWFAWHRSYASATDNYQFLNTTQAVLTYANIWGSTGPSSTDFGINTTVFGGSATFVAYIFAHNAGGFGTSGADNVISCGSFTTDGSGNLTADINLGYEPQWVLWKQTNSTNNWTIQDNMRGMPVTGDAQFLRPNTSGAEFGSSTPLRPTATGLTGGTGSASNTYIYIAIRRGPMKTPTSGTSVYNAAFGSSTTVGYTAGFPVDLAMTRDKVTTSFTWATSRLTGQMEVYTNSTSAESDGGTNTRFDFMTGWHFPNQTADRISWMFKRAPGFMDVVCYTGTGSARTVTHNLGVVPELMIVKNRSAADTWAVYAAPLGATKYLDLTSTAGEATSSSLWSDTTPTSSVFTVDVAFRVNRSGSNLVAYLFATVAGVSKVGSYTGNGGTQAIACGFTGGARFVLIKRTDSTGDWYVYDTARGMTLLTDPYLLLNSTAAETATLGSVTTTTGGFTVDATILAAINTNTASYIFLAIA